MNHLTKPAMLTALLATAVCVLPAAYAEEAAMPTSAEPASPHSLSSNIGFFTDYTFRGISYGREHGAVQGGIDYAHSNGLYAGVWGTNVNKEALYGNTVELDIYGGYVHSFTDQLSLNVGFLQFFYPDSNHPGAGTSSKGGSPNTTDLSAALSYQYFTLKYSYTASNFFGINNKYGGNGNSRGSGYTEFNVNYPLALAGINLALHVGHQSVHNYSDLNYTDWLIGINKDFAIAGSTGWNAGLNYTTTNADDDLYQDAKGWKTGNDRLIGYIKRTF